MQEIITLFCLVAIPMIVSSICWWLLGQPEVSGVFWQRLYLSLTMFIPVLFVLLFAPDLHYDLGKILLFALRWSVLGGVILLLILAYLVRQQIYLLQKEFTFMDKQDKTVVVKAVEE